MNSLDCLSPSALNVIRYAGRKFKLQQILFIPVQSKDEDLIVLYESNLKGKRSNSYSLSKYLNYPGEKCLKKNVHPVVKDLKDVFDNYSRINPYTVQLIKQDLHTVILFNKNPEVDNEWAEEEMEFLDMVGQFIRADLLLESKKRLVKC